MTTTKTRPADILRMAADFVEKHEFEGDISSVGARHGHVDITGYASITTGESAVLMAIRWAHALNVTTVMADLGPKDYHLTVRGTLPDGPPITFTVLTRGPETQALLEAASTGDQSLDQLAKFVREPEAVTA